MLGPGPNRRRCGAWRGVYDCGIKFSLAARCVHARKHAPTNGGMAAWKAALHRLIAGPTDAPPLLQGQVRHLHHQRGLKRELHGSRRRLAGAHAFQEVLHVQIGGPAEAFFGFLLDRRLFLRAFQKYLEFLAPDVHAALVAIQLIELIVAALVLHGRIVHGEDADEVLGILGDGHHRFRLIHAPLVGLARGGGDGAGESGAHQHLYAVEDVRSLVGDDPAGVIGVQAPVAEAVRIECAVGRGALPLIPIERAGQFGGGRAAEIIVQPPARPGEYDYLIGELKRPTKKIDAEVVTQVKAYASAVATDERFSDVPARWTFMAISNELDDFAKRDANQRGRPKGQVYDDAELNITVWVKTWAEVINNARARLTFVNKQLAYQATNDSAKAYLKKTHAKFIPNADEPAVDEKAEAAEKQEVSKD